MLGDEALGQLVEGERGAVARQLVVAAQQLRHQGDAADPIDDGEGRVLLQADVGGRRRLARAPRQLQQRRLDQRGFELQAGEDSGHHPLWLAPGVRLQALHQRRRDRRPDPFQLRRRLQRRGSVGRLDQHQQIVHAGGVDGGWRLRRHGCRAAEDHHDHAAGDTVVHAAV